MDDKERGRGWECAVAAEDCPGHLSHYEDLALP